jgi:hypothetical protein
VKQATTVAILMESAKTLMRSLTTMVDPRMDALQWLREQLAEECPDIARAMLERAVAELWAPRLTPFVARRTASAPRAGELTQRLPIAPLGHPRRHDRP